jgi:hypothetical protein
MLIIDGKTAYTFKQRSPKDKDKNFNAVLQQALLGRRRRPVIRGRARGR